MIVCDLCKSSKCFEIRVPVIKTDPAKKPKDKTVIELKLDLCDPCLTRFMNRLGGFIQNMRSSNASDEAKTGEDEAPTLEESTA